MANRLSIPDFGSKLELLLASKRSKIRTHNQLSQLLRIGYDYLMRIKNGTRTLSEENFVTLCDTFQLTQEQWFLDLETFGRVLSFSRMQVAQLTKSPLPGIDFSSRIRDRRIVDGVFHLIEGYWESFYFAVSHDRHCIARDLCIMRRVNDDCFIECEIIDHDFTYAGHCFPIKNHLYLMCEKTKIFNEIIVYVTNLPDRIPPKLFGLILCLSGGVEGTRSVPSAAKIAFRYLGKDESALREHFAIAPEVDVETYLRRTIPKVVDPCHEPDPLFAEISNAIATDAVPFALQMMK